MSDVIVTSGNRHVEDSGTLSPSQIDTWRDCKRKWAFQYIEHVKPPPGGSAALGSLIHTQLERHLKGEPLDFTVPGHAADIASVGIPYLPAIAPYLEIEKSFKFRSASTGIWYRGFVDLAVPPEHRAEYVPLIHDHKSTSNISAWAKTPEILRTDSQAIIYSKSALLRWPGAEDVDLQWLYMQTKGPRIAKPVNLRISWEDVEDVFSSIELDGQEILATLRRKPAALDLPPTVSACRKYGGCTFQGLCNLSPHEHLAATMIQAKEKSMSETPVVNFLAGLQPTPSPSNEQYAPGCEPPAGDATKSPFFQNLPPSAATVPPLPVSDQPVNPPEFQPPPPSGSAAVAMATQAAVVEKEKKAGRPKGSKNKPKESAEARTAVLTYVPEPIRRTDDGTYPDVTEQRAKVEARAADTIPAPVLDKPNFILYIDCMPIGESTHVFAERYIAQANEEIKSKLEVPEWRIGEPVSYGKGAGFLSARVAELAAERNVAVILDTRTPEGAACKSALMGLTDYVVVGFR